MSDLSLPRSMVRVAALLAALGFSATAGQAAGVVPVDPIHDVGVVSKGKKIEHRFTLRNDGDKTVKIREVEPDCGCAVVEYDESIAAGSSGAVVVKVETKDFRGPIAKTATVYTDDPGNPRIRLVVKAEIRPQIEIAPVYARFLSVVGETNEPSEHFLWTANGPPLEVSNVKSPYPFLKASVRQATDDERRSEGPQRQWKLSLELAADAPVGPLADFVEVSTNHPRQKVLKLPVSGFVRPVIAVTPSVADFGSQDLDEPYRATLEIKNLGSDTVALTSAVTDVSGITTAIEEVEEGKRFLVRVTLEPAMNKGPFKGKLQIQTSSARQPLVEVDLSGTIL